MENKEELIKALIAAQKEFPPIPKTKEAVGRGNHKYMYATLGTILDCVTPTLNKNGLWPSFSTKHENGMFGLFTRITHLSGAFIESFVPIPDGLPPQELGQHLTYKKRYSISGLLAIEAEDDTDAQDTTPDSGPRTSVETTQKQSSPKLATDSQRKMIHARLISIGLPAGPSREVFLASATNKRFIDELTMDEVNPLLKKIAEYIPPQPEDLPF